MKGIVTERRFRFNWALATILGVAIASWACLADGLPGPPDDVLRDRVEAALLGASDVPGSQITVDVSAGVVRLTGSAVCPECGGMSTPNGIGSVLQTIGSVVRAVPGVEAVESDLETKP